MLQAIIAMIIGHIRFKRMLSYCLVETPSPTIEVFEYKGKLYNKERFIRLKVESIRELGISQRSLKETLTKYESNLANSEHPDLDMVLIEAYKRVIR